MTRALYQSHSDTEKGMVDSSHRLARLNIPSNLTDAVVLDIGCNEGFFCNIAAERGAKQVIGIDGDAAPLAYARQRYPSQAIEFRHQSWNFLPVGLFDLVLWTSAMHYEQDPLTVLREIRRRLKPNGILILECGAVYSDEREMILVQRHDGTQIYPSIRLLKEHLLDDFAWRHVAPGELVGSDPVPRHVFHCTPRRPTILVLRGASGHGKTVMASSLKTSATKVISLDMFMYRVSSAKHHHSAFEKHIKAHHTGNNLSELYDSIDAAGLTIEYAKALARMIAPSDYVVVIDGYMTDTQFAQLERVTGHTVRMWDACR